MDALPAILSRPAGPRPELPSPPGPAAPDSVVPDSSMPDARLRRAAMEFEAVFLAEMLRYTGIGDVPEAFGGGVGEEGFASMLIDEYAEAIARTRPLGIAERVYRSLGGSLGGGEGA